MIDNQAAIAMGQMPQFTGKQKHIPIRMCHLKKCCAEGLVNLYPVSSKNELADIGTKALGEHLCSSKICSIWKNKTVSDLIDRSQLDRIWKM
jgi:hypothetical protein